MRRRARPAAPVLPLLLCASLCAAPAAAQPAPAQPAPNEGAGPQEESEAKALFLHGLNAMMLEEYDAALSILEKSYALQPSPNSGLLIARCLRKLGRLSEAAKRYQLTEEEARARIAAGEFKYNKTAESAASEGAEVRAEVGTIKLYVENAPSGTIIAADGRTQLLPEDGRMNLYHPPGEAVVVIQPPEGESVTETVQLSPGDEVDVRVDVAEVARARQTARSRAWALPAALAAGGVGVVGLALFTGFGTSSQDKYDRLKRLCAPSCQGFRDDVEAGDREQTIANVSLAVGLIGLAASGALATYWLTAQNEPERPSVSIRLGIGGVRVQGAF